MRKILLPALILFSGMLMAQLPMNWTVDEVNPGRDITLLADEDRFTEGTRSCLMQLNTAAVPYLISGNFPVNPGTNYSFSIDVLDNDTLGQLKIYCDFYNAVGNNVFGEEPVYSANNPEWKTIQWNGAVPPDAAEGYVLIKFYCEPDAATFKDKAYISVDNCSFVQEGGSNLVINGGFEGWAVGFDGPLANDGLFKIFPNPAKDQINIDGPGTLDRIIITDLTGRTLSDINVDGSQKQLDISGLPMGMYLMNFVGNDALKAAVKFIKN